MHERKTLIVWVSIRSVHSFLTTCANAFQILLLAVPKPFDASILRHPSVSIPEGPEPTFVFIAALHMSSSFIDSNRTGWTFSSSPLIKISFEEQLFYRCSSANWEIVFWSNASIPWPTLFISKFNVALMLAFYTSYLNFLEISAIVDGFWTLFKSFWIEWFHLQKAAFHIHCFSIDLGFVSKTVGAHSI